MERRTKQKIEQNKTKQTKSNEKERKGKAHILHPKANKSKQYITNKISYEVA